MDVRSQSFQIGNSFMTFSFWDSKNKLRISWWTGFSTSIPSLQKTNFQYFHTFNIRLNRFQIKKIMIWLEYVSKIRTMTWMSLYTSTDAQKAFNILISITSFWQTFSRIFIFRIIWQERAGNCVISESGRAGMNWASNIY